MPENASASIRAAVLAKIPADGTPLRYVAEALGLRRALVGGAVRQLGYDGEVLTARLIGLDGVRSEVFLFTSFEARERACKLSQEAVKANRKAHERANNALRAEARRSRSSHAREMAKECRLERKAQERAQREAERLLLATAKRLEREAAAAKRAAERAERKRLADLAKATKIVQRMPGAKQLRTAEAHFDRRRKESADAELKRSNWAKVDPVIPSGLKPTQCPTFKDTRFTVENPDSFRGEFSRAGIGRYTDDRAAA